MKVLPPRHADRLLTMVSSGLETLLRSDRSMGIRSWLFVLAAAVSLPIMAFAGIASHRAATIEYQATLAQREYRTEAAASAVDRYLRTLQELALIVAHSPSAVQGDMQAFHAYAQSMIEATQAGRRSIALVAVDGTVRLSSLVDFASPLPSLVDKDGLDATLRTRMPHVSNLYFGSITKRNVLAVWAPVFDGDKLVSAVVIVVHADELTAILREAKLADGWIATVNDRRSVLVARSHASDDYVGQVASPEAMAAHANSSRGSYALINKEGTAVSASYITLPGSGWTVMVGVPMRLLNAPLVASWWFLVAIGVMSLTVASALALFVAHRLSRQITEVAQTALAVGEGRIFEPNLPDVLELKAITNALTMSQSLIVKRESELRESEFLLRSIIEQMPVGIGVFDREGRFSLMNSAMQHFVGPSIPSVDGRHGSWSAFNDDGTPVAASDYPGQRALRGENAATMEALYTAPDGRQTWTHVLAHPLRDDSGESLGAITIVTDITERKRAQKHSEIMTMEVSHRAKNMLAVVQSVALSTARTGSYDEFAERFTRRLAGLSASQDLLVERNWQGVELSDLLRSQLAHLSADLDSRFAFQGPSVELKPSAAQAIGMAIHELSTNAIKYGALANSEGVIRVVWCLMTEGSQRLFRIVWTEQGGPAVEPPLHRGYGHTVMVTLATQSLEADVTLAYHKAGVQWELTAPVENVLKDTVPM